MATGEFSPIGGTGQIVEVDETFFGKKEGAQRRFGYGHKHAILSLVERRGRLRSFHVEGTSAKHTTPILKANIAAEMRVMTKMKPADIGNLNKDFVAHEVVADGYREYLRGHAHTNSLEGFYSIFKRGMKGIYQHCGQHHLRRYVAELDFRYNNRIRMGVDDIERRKRALLGALGKGLMFRSQVSR